MQKAAPSRDPERAEDPLRRLRISFIQKARLELDGAGEDAFIIDLGLAGVFVERQQPLIVDQRLRIRFWLPGNDIPIEAGCRVAWWHSADAPLVSKALPAGAGLEFVEIAAADSERIRRHIEEHCRRDPRARQFARQWPHRPPREEPG